MEINIDLAAVIAIVTATIGLIEWRFRRFESRTAEKISAVDSHIVSGLVRIDKANARIDVLYQMFIDLLKEGRK